MPPRQVSTKTSKGKETTSQVVARAKAMTAQNTAEGVGKTQFAGSTFEKDYLSSIPAQMSPQSPVNIPPPPGEQNFGDIVGANNVGLASSLGDTGMQYDATSGMFQSAPPVADQSKSLFEQATALDKQAFDEVGTGEDRLNKLEKDNQLKEKQQAVNNYTAKLNQIVANRDASILKLEGENMERGVTKNIFSAQTSRINREAAIEALPVQAQLAAAQGNLEMAQGHIDKMFQIQSQDALAKYQYKSKLIDSVYTFASEQEKRRLDDIRIKEDREYDMQKTNLSLKNDWAKTAIEYGQSSLAGQMMTLDPNSPTFMNDLALLQGKVQKPMAVSGGGIDAPTVKTINGVDMQWNPQTGAWETIAGGIAGAQDPANLEMKYTSILNDIAKARTISDSVGAGWLERNVKGAFSGNNKPAQLQNIADSLKANLLTLNTDPNIKKFFGPQMSNRDTELMTSAGSTLNPVTQDEEEFLKDLTDASNLIIRARQAVSEGAGVQQSLAPINVIVAPDGQEIEIIPD